MQTENNRSYSSVRWTFWSKCCKIKLH